MKSLCFILLMPDRGQDFCKKEQDQEFFITFHYSFSIVIESYNTFAKKYIQIALGITDEQ